jgi:hypothetical protein
MIFFFITCEKSACLWASVDEHEHMHPHVPPLVAYHPVVNPPPAMCYIYFSTITN